jgi:hypothetical protein
MKKNASGNIHIMLIIVFLFSIFAVIPVIAEALEVEAFWQAQGDRSEPKGVNFSYNGPGKLLITTYYDPMLVYGNDFGGIGGKFPCGDCRIGEYMRQGKSQCYQSGKPVNNIVAGIPGRCEGEFILTESKRYWGTFEISSIFWTNPSRSHQEGPQHVKAVLSYTPDSPKDSKSEDNRQENSSIFNDPRMNGMFVDNCLNWGANCQKPAADHFCRQKGFSGAASFALANRRPTLVMGDNKVCDADFCIGFSQIVCGGQSLTQQHPSQSNNNGQLTPTGLQSINYPDRYIRHKGFLGYIDPIQSDLDRNDASFILVSGLANKSYLSFRSVNYPDHYLRHQNFEIKLHRPDGSDLFRNDASFKSVPGLYGQGGSSFESVNYPGYYIRHQNFRLYLHRTDGSELFRQDATFILKPGFSSADGANDSGGMNTNQPAKESVLFYNGNEGGVSPGGRSPSFSIDRAARITYLFTYHYGYNGFPGQIRIVNAAGTVVGTWSANGRSASPKPS